MLRLDHKKNWVTWRTPLYAAIAAASLMLLLFVYSSDPVLDYLFLVPGICVFFLVPLIVVGVKRPRNIPLRLLTGFVFLYTSRAMLRAQDVVRPSMRWFLWSRGLKTRVLAQPVHVNDELRHVEWDGWGGAPVGDWTAYVVFDPSDFLLSAPRDNGTRTYLRYKGIPCKVESVRRLESHWYSVVLGVDEWWDRCGESSSSFLGIEEKSKARCSPPLRCGSE